MATITIAQGSLKGGRCTTDSGFEYFEFLGIPYAKPPVGELRFKSPQSPEPWQGIRDATTIDRSISAYQIIAHTGLITGSEDCLYLNVYTPCLPDNKVSRLKPVMMLSHGGGFASGNGTTKRKLGPDYLIENDVVIVTINYRLGPLGFLCLRIPEAAGNMGLKDHIKALQWIQNNIHKFGGDKHNVTIFGVSAGSAACELLMLSPLAKGLFHRCILQSGTSLNNWALNLRNKNEIMATKLARALGYMGPKDNIKAIYKVLFNASASELTSTAFKITQEERYCVFFGFVPVIEQDFQNGDAFLIDNPYTILKEGRFNQVPVIMGFCNKEGILASEMKPNGFKELIETKSFVGHLAHYLDDYDIIRYDSELKTVYFDNAKPEDKSKQFAEDFMGDLNFTAAVHLAGKLQSKYVPVYMYNFCYDGKLNFVKTLFNLKQKGATHADDIGYLMRHYGVISTDAADILTRSRVTKMWTNFAKTGNPTPDYCPELPVKWPLFTEETKKYLTIDKEFLIEANYEPEKMFIFEQIIRKYYKKCANTYKKGPKATAISGDHRSSFPCNGLTRHVHDG